MSKKKQKSILPLSRWSCVILIVGLLITIGLLLDVAKSEIPPVLQGLHNPPLGCHMRLYTYRITQTDEKGIHSFAFQLLQSIIDEFAGHECWDYVNVWSCWGRCDSREISDWKFPFKKSYHPVCVHAGRSKAVAVLRHCHPMADPTTKRYEYLEANGCHCQVQSTTEVIQILLCWMPVSFTIKTCTTTDTSCEAPNNIRDESSVKVLVMAGINPDDLEY